MKDPAEVRESALKDKSKGKMNWHDLFIQILKKEFTRFRKQNSRLSMRQWSKRIGFSSGAISELLAGQRKVSQKKALEIASAAEVPPSEMKRLLAHMGRPPKIRRVPPKKHEALLIRDWLNQAIIGLYELNAVTINAQVIADRLCVSKAEIESRTERLLEMGTLKQDKKGKIFRERENWDVTSLYSPEELREIKEEAITFALKSFRRVDTETSAFLSATFPGNLGHIKLIREAMMKALDSIDALVDSEPKDELIRFSMQVFPYNFQDD